MADVPRPPPIPRTMPPGSMPVGANVSPATLTEAYLTLGTRMTDAEGRLDRLEKHGDPVARQAIEDVRAEIRATWNSAAKHMQRIETLLMRALRVNADAATSITLVQTETQTQTPLIHQTPRKTAVIAGTLFALIQIAVEAWRYFEHLKP